MSGAQCRSADGAWHVWGSASIVPRRRHSCRAGSCSGSHSRELWQLSDRYFSPTSPRRISTSGTRGWWHGPLPGCGAVRRWSWPRTTRPSWRSRNMSLLFGLRAMMRERWRAPALAREAVRNVASRSGFSRALLVAALVGGSGFPLYAGLQARGYRESVAQAAAAGQYVVSMVSADDEGAARIVRDSCESLSEDPRVERAGAVLASEWVEIDQLSGLRPVVRASASLVDGLRSHDVVLGAAVPQVNGALVVAGFPLEVGRAGPQPAGIDIGAAVVVPLDAMTTEVDQCIVSLRPSADLIDVALDLRARLRTRGGAVEVVGSGLGMELPADRYLGRSDRWVGVLVGAVGGAIAAATSRFRFGEFAVYRLSGTSVRGLVVLVMLEQSIYVGALAASATVTTVLLAAHLVSASAVLSWALAGACSWWFVACVGSAPALARNPLGRRPGG